MTSPMTTGQKAWFGGLASLHLVMLVFGAIYRFVDADEGGMLLVSKEVALGRVPILEINAHNQPLMYYFYGLWMKVFGFTIVSGRLLSVIAIFLTGVLLFRLAHRLTGNFMASAAVYFLFIINLTFFKASMPVKPFGLSNFFIFASVFVLAQSRFSQRPFGAPALFLSGLLLGASLGIRLIYLLPVAAGLWLIYVTLKDGLRPPEMIKKLAAFCAGVVIPMLPSIIIYIKEPVRAYAIWAGAYTQIYMGKGDNPDFVSDVAADIRGELTIRGLKDLFTIPDVALLCVLLGASLVVYAIFSRRKTEKKTREVYLLAALALASITWVYSGMYMGYTSYANQLVPFAVILCLPLALETAGRVEPKKALIAAAAFAVVAAGFYYAHFQKRLNTSVFYMFGSKDRITTPRTVEELSEGVVKKLTNDTDSILGQCKIFSVN